ncbi:hypothetical protein RYX53_16385, partial [Alkalibacillus haloalkaliphilus]|nr:hypothetical protein [Alkalibacillus haloalkaliphilus]
DRLIGEKYTIIQELNDLTSIDEIEQYLIKQTRLVFEYIETYRVSYKDKMVSEVKSYLEENYGKPIQLSDLAALFHMHPSY